MRLPGEKFTAGNPDIRVEIVSNLGGSGGIRAIAGGALGLAATSRPMKEGERKLGAVEMEYAGTPFVFAVSTQSKVTAITSGDMRSRVTKC